MKEQKLWILIGILIFGFVYGASTFYGGRGLFYTYDAVTEDVGLFSTSVFLSVSKTGNFYSGCAVLPNINYTPAKFLEVFFLSSQRLNLEFQFPQFREVHFSSALYQRLLGGKLSIPYIPVVKLGGVASYIWNNLNNTYGEAGLYWDALLSFRFKELMSGLPDILVNYGESKTRQYLKSGIEIIGEKGMIFVEAVKVNDKSERITANLRENLSIIPGIKLNLSSHSYFTLGLKMDNPFQSLNYHVITGLILGGTFFRPITPKVGNIVGTVTDIYSGKKITGQVRIRDLPKIKSVVIDRETGIFKILSVPTGLHVIEIISAGYETLATPILVESNKLNKYDFSLRPIVSCGIVAGNIYDYETRRPIKATIIINNREYVSDSVSGAFRIDSVPKGVTTIEARSSGYYPKVQTIIVEPGKINEVEFPLVPTKGGGIFTGRVVDKITKFPLKAQIIFVNTNISINTDSATGIFYTEIPTGYYQVIVSANGFLAQMDNINIEKNRTTECLFELTPQATKIIFTGKVLDQETQAPLSAKIVFVEAPLDPIISDSLTGIFLAEIPAADYIVEVTADGYVPLRTDVKVNTLQAPKEWVFTLTKQK
jgi:hypothetical protein